MGWEDSQSCAHHPDGCPSDGIGPVEAGNPGTIVGNLAAHAPSPVEPARPTLPAPIQTKPAAVLADYGLQLDQHECSARSGPNASNDQRIGLEVRQQPRLPARWRLRTRS